MRQVLLVAGCCFALVGVVDSAPPESAEVPKDRQAAQADLKKMQGTWDRVAMELEGKTVSERSLEGWVAVYEGDRLTLKYHGKDYRHGIVTLDPSQSPKAVNTWDTDGPYEDQTVAGIYMFDGDTLKVCFAEPGKERPTAFTSKKGTGFLYCEYKRHERPAQEKQDEEKKESEAEPQDK